jgi:methyl-accepting chemotaxis protein
MGNALGFQTKLSVVTVAIVLVTVLCLTVSQFYMANKDALRQGRDGLTSISASLAESVSLQHSLMMNKIRIDRDIMKTQFELSGFPVPEVLMEAEMEMFDQNGGAGEVRVITAIKHGAVYLHEDSSVMFKVAELTGGVASVLQVTRTDWSAYPRLLIRPRQAGAGAHTSGRIRRSWPPCCPARPGRA